MGKGVAIAIAGVGALGLAAAGIFFMAMMVAMMGSGHMGMMSGQGSNPNEETPQAGVTQLRLEDFAFSPANIVVDVGTTVTWTNYDSVGHTVTSDEGDALDSPTLDENESFSFTFREPGAYAYHCQPHPNMKGLVTVRERD